MCHTEISANSALGKLPINPNGLQHLSRTFRVHKQGRKSAERPFFLRMADVPACLVLARPAWAPTSHIRRAVFAKELPHSLNE